MNAIFVTTLIPRAIKGISVGMTSRARTSPLSRPN